MDSTTSRLRPEQQQLAFDPGQKDGAYAERVQPSVSSEPVYPADPVNLAEGAESVAPVWLQRLSIIIQVLFCIELGLLLAVLPWYGGVWNNNSLLFEHPQIRAIVQHNFVRGLVSGLGMVDIWLGIWEAVHYRDRKAPVLQQQMSGK